MKKILKKILGPFKIELMLVSIHLEKELLNKLGTFSKLKAKATPELIRDAIKFYFEKHYYINLSKTQGEVLTGNEIIDLMFYLSLPCDQTPHEVKINAKLVTYMLPKKYLSTVPKKEMSSYITSALCEYFNFGHQYTKNTEKLVWIYNNYQRK